MRALVISVGVFLVASCSDGGGGGTAADTDSSGASTVAATTGADPTTNGPPTTGGPDSTGASATTGDEPATTGTSDESGGSGETNETGSTGTTGEAIDCEAISAGPFAPTLLVSGFTGSEDLAFDGQGGLVLKRGGQLVRVQADLSETVLAQGLAQAYGTRYLADGRLLVALPQAGQVVAYDARGQSAVLLDGLKSPNGIYPDLAGDVWISEFGGSRVLRVAPDLTVTTIVGGAEASSANGVVHDPQRQLLFYSNYLAGRIQRVALDDQGEPGAPETVATVAGAALDGLTLDACGNLYAVDQKNSRLYRVRLDAAGAAIGAPTLLTDFPSNVANAQFGVGAGFAADTLYVAGNPGDVYAVALEFPGAAIVTVQ